MKIQEINELDTNEIIDEAFDGWGDCEGANNGFVAWAWDMQEEIFEALKSKQFEDLAYEIAYTVRQGDHEVTEAEAIEWLELNLEELIEAFAPQIDPARIEDLRAEAAQAGDDEMVAICEFALGRTEEDVEAAHIAQKMNSLKMGRLEALREVETVLGEAKMLAAE